VERRLFDDPAAGEGISLGRGSSERRASNQLAKLVLKLAGGPGLAFE